MESQGATLYTAPGLVPGLLGLVIAALGLLLGTRALRGGNAARSWESTAVVPTLVPSPDASTDDVPQHGTGIAAPEAPADVRGDAPVDTSAAARDSAQGDRHALAVGLLLCLAYALGLVGRVPFALATFLFVTTYVLLFEWRQRGASGERVRGIVLALIYGAGTALIVSTLFEQVFFVRLP